jgi:hypothetical protein
VSAGSGVDERGERTPVLAGQREPFETRNTLGVRSGFWINPMLRPDDRAEVEEIAASIRPLLPVYRLEFELAVEQLACRIWRQRRAYRDLSERGVVRNGEPAPVLGHLAKLEGAATSTGSGLTRRQCGAHALAVDNPEAAPVARRATSPWSTSTSRSSRGSRCVAPATG